MKSLGSVFNAEQRGFVALIEPCTACHRTRRRPSATPCIAPVLRSSRPRFHYALHEETETLEKSLLDPESKLLNILTRKNTIDLIGSLLESSRAKIFDLNGSSYDPSTDPREVMISWELNFEILVKFFQSLNSESKRFFFPVSGFSSLISSPALQLRTSKSMRTAK